LMIGRRYSKSSCGTGIHLSASSWMSSRPSRTKILPRLSTRRADQRRLPLRSAEPVAVAPGGRGLPERSVVLAEYNLHAARQGRPDGQDVPRRVFPCKADERSVQFATKGLFAPTYEEQAAGTQTEVYDSAAKDEHLKRMPTGQMEALVTDHRRGAILEHLHVARSPEPA